MKKTMLKRVLSVILCTVLIAAMALLTIGCSNKTEGENETPETAPHTVEEQGDATEPVETKESDDGVTTLGEGAKQFDFTVVDLDGNETKFIIKTDKTKVGDALLDVKLIEGDAGPYGLYVKKVNGIEADYDKNKTYWGFYIDGEYAMTGVDQTDIEEGKTYSFKVSK